MFISSSWRSHSALWMSLFVTHLTEFGAVFIDQRVVKAWASRSTDNSLHKRITLRVNGDEDGEHEVEGSRKKGKDL